MKHTYYIDGMSCDGCRRHVEDALQNVEGVDEAKVDLAEATAKIKMTQHVDFVQLKQAVEHAGNYSLLKEKPTNEPSQSKVVKQDVGPGVYYCPMQCEGDKTYSKSGSCPVCGMDLVKQVTHEEDAEDDTYTKLLNKLWWSIAFTAPLFIISMSDMVDDNPLYRLMDVRYWNWVQFALSLPVVFYTTRMFFERAYASIVRRSLNMFTLIGIGSGVAWLFSVIGLILPDVFPDQFKTDSGTVHMYFEAATVILTLVLLGQVLEARAHNKTNSAIKELLKLAPNNAYRIEDGKEEKVSINEILVGDILRVKPGDKIPVDGELIEGGGAVDESMITGEPIPVSKGVGDKITSGTINGKSAFLMKAQKIGKDTLLSQIIHMVNEAGRSRAPIQKLADKISTYFVPIVMTISVITFIVWGVFGPEPAYVYGFINAIAVLIIACPCALGLATPMSIMVGVGKGAQLGVLVKNAEALETLNDIDVLLVDKTGTITEGNPSVATVYASQGNDETNLLQLAASLNQSSEHPLAEAMVKKAIEKNMELLAVEDFESVTGKGVQGIINQRKVAVGNAALFNADVDSIDQEMESKADQERSKGRTVSYIAIDNSIVGFLVIADAVKSSSQQAMRQLQERGIEVIMMTGDNKYTAAAVAKSVGIAHFEAECLPEDKLNKIIELQDKGLKVAMAGDGINDSPALAKADVGIAMGTGTDVAIESAMITLVKGDLKGILKAYKLSHAVMKNIRQNLFFALVYNLLGVPIAAGVLFPFFGILLSPMLGAVAMSFSSVSVISNSLRLKTVQID